ncbi:MAG: plastocyanin/azurin family copper-binding protein [Polyangiaceae bacterium]
MRFRPAVAIVPLVVCALSALAVGCEFIASVDRGLIEQPGAGAGASGGAGGGAQGGAPAGGSSAGGNGGTGGVPACTVGTDCPGSDTTCQSRTCNDGVCGVANAAAGTALPAEEQAPGDCKQLVCDGDGSPTTEPDDGDLPDDDQQCTADTWLDGEATFTAAAPGTDCSEGGGNVCSLDGDCVQCVDGGDCDPDETCSQEQCIPASCSNLILDGDETDIDCGGLECPGCGTDEDCLADGDCQSDVCELLSCAAPSCTDTTKNGTETDVDCGGSCDPCGPGLDCGVDIDCVGGDCAGGICVATCTDATKNGTETDVDCGGACPEGCAVDQACQGNADCQTSLCVADVCVASTCNSNTQNGDETDVDCGGAICPPCADDDACLLDTDCVSEICEDAVCGLNGCDPDTAVPLAASVLFGNAVGAAYLPPCFTVSVGDMVTFSGPFASHPFTGGRVIGGVATADATGPFTATSTGTTATFTMSSAGRFGFYCTAHALSGMKGAVFVTP